MELAQDGDEAGVVDSLFFGREGASGAEGFEDVIHRGERKARVLRLHSLAVRVQFLAKARMRAFAASSHAGKGKPPRKTCVGPPDSVKDEPGDPLSNWGWAGGSACAAERGSVFDRGQRWRSAARRREKELAHQSRGARVL